LRGRVVAGLDLGGVLANRITVAGGNCDGSVLGTACGSQNHTLTTAEMPGHTPSGSVSSFTPASSINAVTPTGSVSIPAPGHAHGVPSGAFAAIVGGAPGGGTATYQNPQSTNASVTGITASFTGNSISLSGSSVTPTFSGNSIGSGSSHTTLSPVMVLGKI